MSIVNQVLHDKSPDIYTIAPNATVRSAITFMAKHNIGALVVTDKQQRVVGIISERDYTHKVALLDRSSTTTLVEEIMTKHVFTIGSQDNIDHGLKIMTTHHLRHLPVVDQEVLVGVVSIGDLVKVALEDQRKLIEQLQQYISG